MKDLLPTPTGLNLTQIFKHFDTEEKARSYLEAIRWPSGPVCPHCGNAKEDSIWKIEANPAKKIRAGLYHCKPCDRQFTVTVGTIFEDSKIPLGKWLVAWYLVCSSKKGISSLQLQRQLGLGSYRTALFMTHRIRYALKDPSFSANKLKGTVEVDETWIGGVRKGIGKGNFRVNKTNVVAMVERKGRVRATITPNVTPYTLRKIITEHVSKEAHIMTDERASYPNAVWDYASHQTVNHSAKEYARGDVNTNTVESFFGLLKRGIIGTFHQVSRKHLPLYLAEFQHRYNHREMTDGERMVAGIEKCEGKRMTYKPLSGNAA